MNKDIFYGLMENISSVLANVLLMPIYIHELGAGSFGIISLVSTIMALFVVFDVGIGIATMREILLHKNAQNNFTYISNLVLTLERLYLLISIVIGTIMIFTSSYLANNWFKSNDVSIADLSLSLKLIGLILVFKWPIGLFTYVLMAIGDILLVNKIKFVLSVLQVLISLLLLIVFDFDVIQFLLYLALFHAFYLGTIAYLTWRKNGLKRSQATWDSEALKSIGKFSFGASFFSIVGVLFTVTDKFFVSKYFTLELLGLYTVISILGFSATQVIYPITTALFKQYSFYYFRMKVDISNFRYRYAFHLLSVFILTFTGFCITFQDTIILLRTQDAKKVAGLKHVGPPFLLGILFYAWHNVAIIPLTIRGVVKQLNLLYGCC
jgi:O-antigen/teichoic acid export membrane protein